MDLGEFNDFHLNNLLDNMSNQNRNVFLSGDFDVEVVKYDQHLPTSEFLDSLSGFCSLILYNQEE